MPALIGTASEFNDDDRAQSQSIPFTAGGGENFDLGPTIFAIGGGMTRWRASVLAILLASFPGVVSAQVDCGAIPQGPARTDCYLGLSQFYRGQSDVAVAKARVQSDIARYRQIAGAKHKRHRK
jgi:hypothetical protein